MRRIGALCVFAACLSCVAFAQVRSFDSPTIVKKAPTLYSPDFAHSYALMARYGMSYGESVVPQFENLMFGFYLEEYSRLDLEQDGNDPLSFNGSNIFGQTFHLTGYAYDPLQGPESLADDVSIYQWYGTASSSFHNEELATVGIVLHSVSLNQTRFVPIVIMTNQIGNRFVWWMGDPEHRSWNISECNMGSGASFYETERGKYETCFRSLRRGFWMKSAFCWGTTGLACLFPPTSVIGCPGLLVCQSAVGACGLMNLWDAQDNIDEVYNCFCTIGGAGGTNFDRCTFKCPSCALPPTKAD